MSRHATVGSWSARFGRATLLPARVNLLIAEDVGLGKTIESGRVIQEMMLRHRIRSVLIVCPSGLQIQWREQMCDKFGLDFRIIDSDAMKHLRRSRGLHVNPSPGDVANILRGAAHAMAAERRRQQVELVWSGPTTLSSTLRSTGSALLDLIRGARQSVCLVTFAAYKVPDVVEIIGVVKGPKT